MVLSPFARAAAKEAKGVAAAAIAENIGYHMAHIHGLVALAARKLMKEEGKAIHVTPRSYLELIALFKQVLAQRSVQVSSDQRRFTKGLEVMAKVADDVASLKEDLRRKMIEVQMNGVLGWRVFRKCSSCVPPRARLILVDVD